MAASPVSLPYNIIAIVIFVGHIARSLIFRTLQWRHNERNDISSHRRLCCLLSRWFRGRLKKSSKLRVTGLCGGNSPVSGEFPAQRASNAENVSIWWRHLDHLESVASDEENTLAAFWKCWFVHHCRWLMILMIPQSEEEKRQNYICNTFNYCMCFKHAVYHYFVIIFYHRLPRIRCILFIIYT